MIAVTDMDAKEYLEKYRKLLDLRSSIPSEEDIDSAADEIESKISSQSLPEQVIIGYRAGVRLLRARKKEYAGIGVLPSLRARAVAMLAVDYMNGLCSRRNLLGIKPEI